MKAVINTRAKSVDWVFTTEWLLFKKNPYPELAKGLIEYWIDPKNLRIIIEEGGGRWVRRTRACTRPIFGSGRVQTVAEAHKQAAQIFTRHQDEKDSGHG